jgi:hypothetical protein
MGRALEVRAAHPPAGLKESTIPGLIHDDPKHEQESIAMKPGLDNATPAGRRMILQLSAIHKPLRADVALLRRIFEELTDNTDNASEIRKMLAGLSVAQVTWQLQSRCRIFCQGLSVHHMIEDAHMLPTMRRNFPELSSVVARLRRDHEEVDHLINGVLAASEQLSVDDAGTVHRLKDLMVTLADHLETHLDFEEESLFPYFARMSVDWHHG